MPVGEGEPGAKPSRPRGSLARAEQELSQPQEQAPSVPACAQHLCCSMCPARLQPLGPSCALPPLLSPVRGGSRALPLLSWAAAGFASSHVPAPSRPAGNRIWEGSAGPK